MKHSLPAQLAMAAGAAAMVAVIVVLSTVHPKAPKQTESDLPALKADHAAEMAAVLADAEEQQASLYDNYAEALETPAKKAAAYSDGESVLAIRKEQKTARKEHKAGEAILPDIAAYRALLQKAALGIDNSVALEKAALDVAYLRKLEVLKTALAGAGRIDEAADADAEMRRLKVQMQASNLPPGLKLEDLVSPVLEEVVARVGLHKPRHQVQVGGPDPAGKDKPHINGLVTSRSGTVVEDANIFIQQGEWKGEGTLFRHCKLEADLGGRWTLRRSLLDDCTLAKGGAWFVRLWSSHWVFDNCAFTKRFMTRWETHSMGIKATHCTFHDVNFETVWYATDAGREAADEWMTFKDCKFINCKVPETLLIATKDCVFEGCRFERQNDDLPGATPTKVRLYAPPLTELPMARKGITYEVHDPKERTEPAGATIRYSLTGGSLQF